MALFSKLRQFHRRHRENERGAVLILTAASLVLILGAGALGVDVGFTVYGSRTAQAMADAAALDLAQDIPTIDNQASNAAVSTYISSMLSGVDSDNGSNAYLYAVPGVWQNGTFTTLSGGCAGTVFLSPPLACNAIEVWGTQSVPQVFWGGFNSLNGSASNHGAGGCSSSCTPPPGAGCSASPCTPPPGTGCTGSPCTPPSTCTGSCDAWAPKAGFTIGSYLASYNSQQTAVLNVLLGKLGGSASVTAVGYQGLAGTYVSLSQLITASGGVLTNQNVLTTSLTGAQWLTLLGNAVGNQVAQLNCGGSPTPLPCEASTGLSALNFNSTTSAELCQMVSVNGSSCNSPNNTVSTSALSTDVDLLQMLATEAELANGTNALDVKSALGITGVTSASLSLHLIAPAGSAWGPVGSYTSASQCPAPSGQSSTCATTAQISADLTYTALSLLGQPQTFDIPLSAVTGIGTLNSVSCSNMVFQNMTVNVGTTGASGTVTENGSALGTVTVNGVSNKSGTYSNVSPNAVPPTAASAAAGKNPSKFGTTSPVFTFTGSGFGLLDATLSATLTTVAGALGPVLQATGVSLAGAEIAATPLPKCDAIQIVG